ncbi:hypothetical protein M3Y98_00637400 [Aphelenchoides besseyi]|nr:hypothetical protein M3Y98_00637400 [Aphelenchoides besseyi]
MNGCLACVAISNGSHVQFDCVMKIKDKGLIISSRETIADTNVFNRNNLLHSIVYVITSFVVVVQSIVLIVCVFIGRQAAVLEKVGFVHVFEVICVFKTTQHAHEEPPALMLSPLPPIQHSSDNQTIIDNPKLLSSPSKFEVTDGTKNATRRFVRSTCGVCLAHYRGTDELDTICVEHGDVEDNCRGLTKLLGGALTCNHEETKCCCKGSTCDSDFALKFLGYQLPSSSVSAAYSTTSYVRPSALFLLTMIYGLLC